MASLFKKSSKERVQEKRAAELTKQGKRLYRDFTPRDRVPNSAISPAPSCAARVQIVAVH